MANRNLKSATFVVFGFALFLGAVLAAFRLGQMSIEQGGESESVAQRPSSVAAAQGVSGDRVSSEGSPATPPPIFEGAGLKNSQKSGSQILLNAEPPVSSRGAQDLDAQGVVTEVENSKSRAQRGNDASASSASAPGEAADRIAVQDSVSQPSTTEIPSPDIVNGPTIAFENLALDHAATCMEMTEDGRFVLFSHEGHAAVSVYDVQLEKRIATLKTKNPRSILCRGDQVFVANARFGTISVFSQTDWKFKNQLTVERPGIVHIDAPQGNRFANSLIVTCHKKDPDRDDNYREAFNYLIDTKQGICREVAQHPLASCSSDGRLFLAQDWLTWRSHWLSATNFDDLLARESRDRHEVFNFSGVDAGIPFMYQLAESSYWLGANLIMTPIARTPYRSEGLLIPDASQRLVYEILEDRVRSIRLNSSLSVLNDRSATFPEGWSKPKQHFDHAWRFKNYYIDHPVAYTHGQYTYLFAINVLNGTVVKAKTERFKPGNQAELLAKQFNKPDTKPAVASPRKPAEVVFNDLPFDEHVSCMTTSEDQRLLVLSHEMANRVSVYDIVRGTVVKTLSTASPREVLSRGDQLFVANMGSGTVSVFDQLSWQLVGQLKLDRPNISCLSAPAGKNFKDQLLVSVYQADAAPQVSMDKSVTFLCDLKTGENREINTGGVLRTSNDGNYVIRQPQLERFMFDDLVNTGPLLPENHHFRLQSLLPDRWHVGRIQTLYQVRSGGYWFSFGGAFGGIPKAVPGENGEFARTGQALLIPNRSQPTVCMLTEDLLKAAALNCVLSPLEFRRVKYAPGHEYVKVQAQRDKFDYQSASQLVGPPVPVCVTHENDTFLFAWDANTAKLLFARTTAFPRRTEEELVKLHGQELQGSIDAPTLTFRRLPLDKPTTFMAMTENGRYLVATHQTANRISIYDVRKNELVKSISSESPRSVLCRGDTVFVGNFGQGTISAYNIENDWELSGTIEIHQPFIVHMSAPGGEFYNGRIVVVCHRDIGSHNEVESHVYVVDTSSDNYREISDERLATVSYRGDILAANALAALDLDSTVLYPEDFSREQPYIVEGSNRKRGLGFFYQLESSNYWLGRGAVLGGVPLTHVLDSVEGVLVPEINRKVAYSLTEDMLRMHRLDSTFTPLGSRQVAFAGAKFANLASIVGDNGRRKMSIADHPIAVTHEGRTTFFVRDMANGSILMSLTNHWRDIPQSAIHVAPKELRDEPSHANSEGEDRPAGFSRVSFRALPLEDPVTCRALTEDGQVLVITHQLANLVTFYDVRERRVISQATTLSPRAVLCRGGMAYVTNYGEGTISVFKRGPGWKFVDQVSIADKYIQHLSAPGGEYYRGKILANCFEQNVYGRNSRRAHLIDVKTGESSAFDVDAQLVFSYDGKRVVEATDKPRAMNFEQFFGDNSTSLWASRTRGGAAIFPTQCVLPYQIHDTDFWLDPHAILSETKVVHRKRNYDGEIVPDATKRLAYFVSRTELEAIELDGECKTIGRRTLSMPSMRRGTSTLLSPHDRIRGFFLDHSVAATHGDKLHIFVLDVQRNVILVAETPAFIQESAPEREHELPSPSSAETAADADVAASRIRISSAERAGSLLQRQASLLESRRLLDGFPKLITATEPLQYQVKVPKAVTVELRSDIEGLSLTPLGEIVWTPKVEQVGLWRIKLALLTDGRVYAFGHEIVEVADPELEIHQGQDTPGVRELTLGRNAVLNANHRLKRHLVLQENEMLVLEGDGLEVVERIKLPNLYSYIAEREDTWVAATNYPEPAVDIISKDNLKVLSRVNVQPAGAKRARVQGLELHPHRDENFVLVSQQNQGSKVIRVHERSGEAEPLGVIGNWLKVTPDGRWLITGLRAHTSKGNSFYVPPSWSVIDIPDADFESVRVEALIRWKLGSSIRPDRFLDGLGFGGIGFRMSPDGRFASYLSPRGLPPGLNRFAAVNVSTFKIEAKYASGDTVDLAYHPFLPVVALASQAEPQLFNRSTGKPVEHGFVLSSSGLGNTTTIKSIVFSPDGMNLMLVCHDNGKNLLKTIRLSRSVREMERLPPTDRIPYGMPIEPQIKIARDDLHALTKKESNDLLSAREISGKYMDATVLVQSDEDIYGTGIVVGKKGLILTAAHVIDRADSITVYYTRASNKKSGSEALASENTQPKMFEAIATLVMADEQLDLALLKVDVPKEMTHASILLDGRIESGEKVVVVGNPVLGSKILSHTLTTGVVSNPNREINGRRLVQTSAPVNPGNSGGPMFNSRGYVVGLVSAKGEIANTAFAVPAAELLTFLRRALAQP